MKKTALVFLATILALFAAAPINAAQTYSYAQATCSSIEDGYAFVSEESETVAAFNNSEEKPATNFFQKLGELFFKPQKSGKLPKVHLGGTPIGISLDGDGVIIIGINDIVTEKGLVCPAVNAGIHVGDKIISLGGTQIRNTAQLSEIAGSSFGNALELIYIRDKESFTTSITPVLDIVSNSYKLGLWAKDGSSGVGTLTFVHTDLRFACLGHPIVNSDGSIYEVKGGSVFNCEIIGVNRGTKGATGQLKGTFGASDRVGEVGKNCKYGVYGKFDRLPYNVSQQTIEVASRSKIKMGAAQVYTTVDGTKPKMYDIEIVKIVNQTAKDDKGMVIRVVDKDLIDKTGGIVQGMSGSPILQDGKLIGAVTHVFVSDPTKGYGLFAEWMLTE